MSLEIILMLMGLSLCFKILRKIIRLILILMGLSFMEIETSIQYLLKLKALIIIKI